MVPGLCALPHCRKLRLDTNGICDEGLAALVTLGDGVLQSLVELVFNNNQLTDGGCSILLTALSNGALPSLKRITHVGNPARAAALLAVDKALASRSAG